MPLFSIDPEPFTSLNPSFNSREVTEIKKGSKHLSFYITFNFLDAELYLKFFEKKIRKPKIRLLNDIVSKNGIALTFYSNAHYAIRNDRGVYEGARFSLHADLDWIFKNKPTLNLYKTLAKTGDPLFNLQFLNLNLIRKI